MRSKGTRMERMTKQLMRDFSDIIRSEMKFPESFKLLSVTHVDLAADYSNVKVYVSHLKEGETEPSVTALNNQAGQIRERLKWRVAWRKIPVPKFYEDDSLKRGFDMIRKIERLAGQAGTAPLPQESPAEPSTPE